MKQPLNALRTHLQRTIVGQDRLLDNLLVALLCDGHALIEGLPGLAKTTAVRALAEGIDVRFQRIQFTPDLIPGDITGSDIYVPEKGSFKFIEGPLFNEIVLADEINRAPPKVQSALLEAMQEHQVTVGGVSRALPEIFLVIATQNPIEHEGTFPLPEAQLDRFLLKIELDYPNAGDEFEILQREQARLAGTKATTAQTTLDKGELLEGRKAVNQIYLDEKLGRYIVALVQSTREPQTWLPQSKEWLRYGASPRATLALARTARAHAFLQGRDFVEPGDILEMAMPVLQHRIGLNYAARAEEITTRDFIGRLLEAVPIP